MVAQSIEQSLPTPKVCCSNPVIYSWHKHLPTHCKLSRKKRKEFEAGLAHLKKYLKSNLVLDQLKNRSWLSEEKCFDVPLKDSFFLSRRPNNGVPAHSAENRSRRAAQPGAVDRTQELGGLEPPRTGHRLLQEDVARLLRPTSKNLSLFSSAGIFDFQVSSLSNLARRTITFLVIAICPLV